METVSATIVAGGQALFLTTHKGQQNKIISTLIY
jgi:uncharacterized membrane protein